ncbi:MAG: chemotaxis protein CheB, partial [Ignavibacteriaceae bacterium]
MFFCITNSKKNSSKKSSNSDKKNDSVKFKQPIINSEEASLTKREDDFPIVGIGASAGGLEAFSELLNHLSEDTGLAFVFIQHLSPDHESLLSDLLSKKTKIPVHEVVDRVKIKQNNVYIIKPNTNIELEDGTLHVTPREENSKNFLPIDFFMRSLAEIKKNKAIGVILSGTGSDGTLGMRAIKGGGGLTFAQDLKSAKFSGMPNSAYSSGNADFILSPDDIAKELTRIGRHPYVTFTPQKRKDEIDIDKDDNFSEIFSILLNKNDVDFKYYKPNTIKRRIERRMALKKIKSIENYSKYLIDNSAEVDDLFQDLLIHVTGFFRDSELFKTLKEHLFPRMVQNKPVGKPLRVWIPGCSSGEEAYSIAICLLEFLEDNHLKNPVQIFATDINDYVIDKARTGIFSENILQDVSEDRIKKFFVKSNGGYQISRRIRELCVFAKQNIAADPPFSKIDLISCRNLLIYLNSFLQKKVIPTFHYSLNPDGILILGTSESIGSFADLFRLIDKKHKVYLKKHVGQRTNFDIPFKNYEKEIKTKISPDEKPNHFFDISKEVQKILLSQFTPPGVLVDDDMNVIQFIGNTGRYLEPAAGAASFNLFKMCKDGLLLDLRSAVKKAKQENKAVTKKGVNIKSSGSYININLNVVPILHPNDSKPYNFLVLFKDEQSAHNEAGSKTSKSKKDFSPKDSEEIKRLEDELTATKEYLQSLINEKDAANEELRSTLEELQSSNEEMQSTNEEMETAKEELQSTNEELITVNDELENQNNEQTIANNDLVNLLTSVNIPLIILNNGLRIRRFTPAAEKVFNLIPTDVGRVFNDIRPNINIKNFNSLINEVMNTLETKELEIQDSNNKWYVLRIKPYRTLDNKIDGVVIILTDIHAIKSSLNAKQTLLTESHHRIKNNLQVVQSLLSLQSGYLKDEESKVLFQESQSRIRAMSLIHDKLYHHTTSGKV